MNRKLIMKEAIEDYKKNPSVTTLYSLLRGYCTYNGESPYELLDDDKFIIPYFNYLINNYPQIFTGDYEYCKIENIDNIFIFDLEAAFTNWAEDHMQECPFKDVKYEWEWEELVFSSAMFEANLNNIVVERLIEGFE